MKRLFTILLLFLMLPCLCACAKEEKLINPVAYHYLRAPQANGEISHGSADSIIAAEIREGDGYQENYNYLLDIYLLGPLDRDYRSPYPVGTSMKDFQLDGTTARILLSDDFGKLSGIDLTLACGCLTLTIMDLTGADTVTVMAEDTLLDGRESITMNRSNMILTDDSAQETD